METGSLDPKFTQESLLSLTFPSGYEYLIESVTGTEESFKAVFRISGLNTPQAADKWISQYSEKNQVTWRVRASHNPKGRTILWKKDLRCERNTDRRSHKGCHRVTKNTNCPAKLKITMKKFSNKSREKKPDPFKKDWPCVVELFNQHNHSPDSNPRFRSPSEETKEKLIKMYQQGHSPTSAWRAIRTELLLKHPENFESLITDGRFLPTVSVCTHLFHQAMKNKDKIINCRVAGDSLKDSLQRRLDDYAKNSKGRAVYGKVNEDAYLALCTPLMRRAHTLLCQSSEAVTLDVYTRTEPAKRKRSSKPGSIDNQTTQEFESTNFPSSKSTNKERPSLVVYFLLTSTPAGYLPLGIIICDSNNDEVFRNGLEALQECFPSTAFFSKPQPRFFELFTEYKEGSPLQSLYPQSGFMLSHCYLLQSAWSWLCDFKKNKILEVDRHELYYGIRNLLNSQSDLELVDAHWKLKCHSSAQKYPKFHSYLENLFNMRGLWATFYYPGITNQGTVMNSYVPLVFRVFKDCILHKVRASSFNQLFDVLSTELDTYMESTIIDFCYNCFPKTLLKFLPSPVTIDLNQIVPHTEKQDCYVVPNEKDPVQSHFVYLNNASCSCLASSTGRLCKHISAVLLKFSESNAYTSCDLIKKIMYEVATEKVAPSSWETPVIPSIIHEVRDSVVDKQATVTDKPTCENVLSPDIADAKKILKSIFERLENSILVQPTLFIPALKQMEKNFGMLDTDDSLSKALHSFGQNSTSLYGINSEPYLLNSDSGSKITSRCCNTKLKDTIEDGMCQIGNNLKAITTDVVNTSQVGVRPIKRHGRDKNVDNYYRCDSENITAASINRTNSRTNARVAPYFVPIAPKPGGPKPGAPKLTAPNPKSTGPKLRKVNMQDAPVVFVVDN